jgi:myo-inositol catabolism protein IolH
MKIAFDSTAFWGTSLSFEEIYDKIAKIGYKYINPYHPVFPGFIKRPKLTNTQVLWHKNAIKNAGLKVASLTTGFRIADPDEFMRECAIDHWKRMFDIGDLMEVNVFNTELGGDIHQPALCEEKLMRSLDVLVPVLEKRGMRMDFQAHPYDFIENSNETADIIRSYDSGALGYLYSIPHTFFYDGGKGDIAAMLKYAGSVLKHIIVADTYDHTKTFRYNMNPPTADARIHAHIGNIGEGDINWKACFETLGEMKFGQQEDTIATFNPLGFPELAEKDGRHVLKMLTEELMEKPVL